METKPEMDRGVEVNADKGEESGADVAGAGSGAGRPSASIVSEIVASMTVLMIAAILLISIFVSWSYSFLSGEYAVKYAPYIIVPYILLFGATVAVYGWYLISRVIVRPVRSLVEATRKIAAGDLSYQVPVLEDNELGQLAASFNRMTRRLEQNRWELLANLSEMKRLNENLASTQRELLSTEKLASVGRLAAGVAHEIGNPLAAMAGYLELLLRRSYIEAKDREMVARIGEEVKRINEIIKELLDYSRPPDESVAELDLNEAINSTIILMSAQKECEKVEIKTNPGKLPPLRANRSSVQQLLMNLVMNAIHAMPGGGVLKISTRPAGLSGQSGMELMVEDSGTGISPENLERIFDPFFTTKEPGQGTGLGLSICLRIVENMKGKISVQSTPGKGSVFTVWLPGAKENE